MWQQQNFFDDKRSCQYTADSADNYPLEAAKRLMWPRHLQSREAKMHEGK
jgi:hypothetical protein